MSFDYSSLCITVTKPKSQLARKLAKLGVRIISTEEEEGNIDRFIISERLAIEHRTGSTFLRGIMDKTLFTSAIYLREHFQIPILIMEGEVNHQYTQFSPQAVRGALTSMMIEYGVNILATPNLDETAQIVCMIARQEQLGIPEISFVPKRKAVNLADIQRRVVEMLPGCGRVLARELLQTFGSVKRIMNASSEEFQSFKGIGQKKATKMIIVLNAEYESVDTEKDLEYAIEASPKLLFEQPVHLLARQHFIFSEGEERHIVDLVFIDHNAQEAILVELKRGALSSQHEDQLKRYLDNANKSDLLRHYLEQGMSIRGVLATIEECEYSPQDPTNISVIIVDKADTIKVLKKLRELRLKELGFTS